MARLPCVLLSRLSAAIAVAFAAILFVSVAAAETQDAKTLRLVSDVWPPFTDVDGKARVAIDLVQEALKRTGVAADSAIRTDSDNLIDAIRAGEFDGSAALWRNAERESFLLFSRPYLENRLVLVGLKGSDLAARSLAELAGKRVAVVRGYAYGDEVRDAQGPVFVAGPSDGDNLQSLLRGEVDYVLADELLVRHLFERYEAKARRLLQVGEVALVTRPLHFAVREDHPGAAAIVRRFDREIRRMMADGAYNRILQLDWIQADVDGDGKLELVLGGKAAGTEPPKSTYEVFSMQLPDPRRVELAYLINGREYDDWEDVPVEYKIPYEHGVDPARPGIVLFDF